MKDWLRKLPTDLNVFFKMFLPKGKTECYLLAGLVLFYLSYSLYLVFKTSIIDNTNLETDIYFSFDNPMILKYGRTQVTGHPLLSLFYYPFVILGNLLAMLAGFKAKTVLFVLLSSTLISMSCVYINRYLKEIIAIKPSIALFITLFYAVFSTNLILAFTPESFTLATFFLSFNVYYYSAYIKQNQTPPFVTTALLSHAFLGGVTITNFAKGVIPNLFLNTSRKNICKRLVGLGLILLLMMVVLQLAFYFVLGKDLIGSMFIHRGAYTFDNMSPSDVAYYAFTHFFGPPIFLDEIKEMQYARADQTMRMMLNGGSYQHWWQYLYISLLLAAVVIAFARNYRNKFAQMIFLLLFVDLFLHIILKFGLAWPFIYGGHWVYCIPLMLGWLYKSLNGKWQTAYSVFIASMFIGMIINNLTRLSDFISLATENFPAIP